MTHKIIAIDGPAASGKGTLARALAHKLNYAYLDTGALYRAVALRVLDSGGKPEIEDDAIAAAKSLSQNLKPSDLQNPALRNDLIGQGASMVAKFPGVREALFDFQKDFAAHPKTDAPVDGVILDGRDIGTVICPDADVKLFVTASVEERARRRLAELAAKNIQTDFETVLAEMKQRDTRDSGRDFRPMKPADDAHILDTSAMTAQEAFDQALALIRSKLS